MTNIRTFSRNTCILLYFNFFNDFVCLFETESTHAQAGVGERQRERKEPREREKEGPHQAGSLT